MATRHELNTLKKISDGMVLRGLEPKFRSVNTLQTTNGRWLVIMLDAARIERIEQYTSAILESQMRMILGGKLFFIIESSVGVFYLALLSEFIQSTDLAVRETIVPGVFQLGVDYRGNEVSIAWNEIGHTLVAGMTGSGKSVFLRNLVTQAIADELRLFLIDADEMTFSALNRHPLLGADIGNLSTATSVLEEVMKEIAARQTMMKMNYPTVEGYWSLPAPARTDFPPVLLAIDEANGLISALGGVSGNFSDLLKQIAWRGRKFGIVLVVAGQTFEKAVVGQMRDQLVTRVCFRVADANVSRIVLGKSGAEKIKTPGRAITNRWGIVQTYYVDKFDYQGSPVNDDERRLIETLVVQFDGKMTYDNLSAIGFSRGDARKIRDDFQLRNLAEVDKADKNSLVLTEYCKSLVFSSKLENTENSANWAD